MVQPGAELPRKRVLIAAWLRREHLTSRQLEDETRISRQTMTALKAGRDVRLSTMVKILEGARVLAHRRVAIEELFDFDSP
jgi:hypothetical protein